MQLKRAGKAYLLENLTNWSKAKQATSPSYSLGERDTSERIIASEGAALAVQTAKHTKKRFFLNAPETKQNVTKRPASEIQLSFVRPMRDLCPLSPTKKRHTWYVSTPLWTEMQGPLGILISAQTAPMYSRPEVRSNKSSNEYLRLYEVVINQANCTPF